MNDCIFIMKTGGEFDYYSKIIKPFAFICDNVMYQNDVRTHMIKDPHILVIEDDYDLLFMIKKLLEINGYKVLTAISGKEGKQKFRQYSRQLRSVILDLTLPDQDGKRICQEFRRKKPKLSIIITTGSEDRRQRSELEAIGIDAYLRKPFDLQELLHFVSSKN